MLDLFHESQEEYQPKMWKRKHEKRELDVAAGLAKKAKFTKLDLTSIILARV